MIIPPRKSTHKKLECPALLLLPHLSYLAQGCFARGFLAQRLLSQRLIDQGNIALGGAAQGDFAQDLPSVQFNRTNTLYPLTNLCWFAMMNV